jgi:hypothetical protein
MEIITRALVPQVNRLTGSLLQTKNGRPIKIITKACVGEKKDNKIVATNKSRSSQWRSR